MNPLEILAAVRGLVNELKVITAELRALAQQLRAERERLAQRDKP